MGIEAEIDSIKPLRGFVHALSLGMPLQGCKNECDVLSKIINACSKNPTEVTDALAEVKSATPAKRPMIAAFRMIPEGKKIIALVEEYVAGRADALKVVGDINDIKTKALSFQEVSSSLTMQQSVSQCLDLVSLLRPFIAKKIEDDGTKDALKQAIDEVVKLSSVLVGLHVSQEASVWLSTQAETLKASRVISKPPGFDIMKLLPEFKSVLSVNIQALVDLESFYKSLDAISGEVDALLRMPPGPITDDRRTIIVRLCQASQTWQDSKSAVLPTCPGLYIPCKCLGDVLESYVGQECVKSWQLALVTPMKLVSGAVVSSWTEETFKQSEFADLIKVGIERIADAKLLATGFRDETVKADVAASTAFVEAVVSFAKLLQAGDPSIGSTVKATQDIFIAIGLMKADSLSKDLETEIKIDSDAIKCLGFQRSYFDS